MGTMPPASIFAASGATAAAFKSGTGPAPQLLTSPVLWQTSAAPQRTALHPLLMAHDAWLASAASLQLHSLRRSSSSLSVGDQAQLPAPQPLNLLDAVACSRTAPSAASHCTALLFLFDGSEHLPCFTCQLHRLVRSRG